MRILKKSVSNVFPYFSVSDRKVLVFIRRNKGSQQGSEVRLPDFDENVRNEAFRQRNKIQQIYSFCFHHFRGDITTLLPVLVHK